MGQVINFNSTTKSHEKKYAVQKYRRGDKISVLNLGVWQVYQGVLQLSIIRSDESEVIVGFVTANGTFANNLSGSTIVYRALALSNVHLRYYPEQDLANSPILAKNVLVSLSDRLSKTQHLSAIMRLHIKERLRQLLLMLKQEIGIPSADGVRLQVRFTHKHLAQIVGSTRVQITQILGDFRRAGLIYWDTERHIIITGL